MLKSLVTGTWCFLTASSAFALEPHAVLAGRFEWIISRDVQNQYPNVNLEQAQNHFVPRIEANLQPHGLFTLDVTMPTTLSGGQQVIARYEQVRTGPDDDMTFVNRQKPNDRLECSPGTDSWVDMYCGYVSLKQLQNVPQQQRENYVQQQYGAGSQFQTGMHVVALRAAGAEPGGKLVFLDPRQENPAPWLGRWQIEYTSPQGQRVRSTMQLDGYSGWYRPQGSNQVGIIRKVQYDETGEMSGTWEMGGSRGWFRFTRSGNQFTGNWGNQDDDWTQPRGSWSGHR